MTAPFTFLMLPPQSDIARGWARRLAAELPQAEVIVADTAAEAEAALPRAGGIYGTLTPDLLRRAENLCWLQVPFAAPPAGYYFEELVAHPVVATNMREIYNDHIGAHVMAWVLMFARNFQTFLPQQARHEWRMPPLDTGVVDLASATMLVVGLGGIGMETARLAATFGMTVIATDPRRTAPTEGVSELHPADALDGLAGRADFVVVTIPHTPRTEGMFDRAFFRRMKKGAFFINVGRGMTTRLDALVEALRAGDIGGAGLDVFETEPLPADHPLWAMPGVFLTPHTAAYGPHLDERRYAIIRDNLAAMMTGGPLRNVVDKASWF